MSGVSLSTVLGVLVLLIIFGLFGGLYFYESQLTSKIGLAKSEIEKKEKSIDEQKFKEIYDLQERTDKIRDYEGKAVDQLKVLNIISSRTFTETLFQDLSMKKSSGSNSLVEADILVSDYDNLAKQLSAYERYDRISEVKMENSSLEESGLSASIKFEVRLN